MAIGSLTFATGDSKGVGGVPSAPIFVDQVSFAGEVSYPTGGMLGLQTLLRAEFKDERTVLGFVANDCGGYVAQFVPSTGAVKVYYGNFDAADGPLIEVPNATDLSAVTFRLLVISR